MESLAAHFHVEEKNIINEPTYAVNNAIRVTLYSSLWDTQ